MDRTFAKFRLRRVVVQPRQIGATQGDPQNNTVVTTDENMGDLFGTARDRLNQETLAEERLSRIGNFYPLTASVGWVVEAGINMWCRSIE